MLFDLRFRDFCDKNYHELNKQVEYVISLGAILESTSQPSSKVQGGAACQHHQCYHNIIMLVNQRY